MSAQVAATPVDWLRQFRRKVTQWYDANRRSLPWRETADPYAIWISETMLQQTQVATVIDYYTRFLKRFPNVKALAAAEEQEVLELWAGLGYYRRARQLHAAAKVIVQEFDARFPTDLADIQSLPGIGRYTAGAIASFAFDTRAPIVEANTVRLYSRLIALQTPTQSIASQQLLWNFAETILPTRSVSGRSGAGRLNQAVMELGSQICKPQAPLCSKCPVQSLCPTHARGLEGVIPVAKPKKLFTPLVHIAVLIEHRGRLLLRRNAAGEWWEGLWDFPRADLAKIRSAGGFDAYVPGSPANLELTELAMLDTYRLKCRVSGYLKTLRHSVTRYKITLHCFSAKLESRAMTKLDGDWRWVDQDESLPLCAPAKRLRQMTTQT